MKLIPYRGELSLVNLYMYNVIYGESLIERDRFKKLTQFMDSVLALYSEYHEELCEERQRLKLEIRLLAKGTPVTEPMSVIPETVENYERLTESQRIAFTELLKKAYKAAAMLCHPDRGGDPSVFAELEEAYRHRDLTRVNTIYITLSRGRNLYWQASEEGLEWASTELNRPMVRQEMLKSSPMYEIVKHHACGRMFKANTLMRKYLLSEIQTLQAELHFLRTKNGHQENRESSEIEIEGERHEGPDSAGESATGTCLG